MTRKFGRAFAAALLLIFSARRSSRRLSRAPIHPGNAHGDWRKRIPSGSTLVGRDALARLNLVDEELVPVDAQ